MPEKTFRVGVFHVEFADDETGGDILFETAIEEAASHPLDERARDVNSKIHRLEHFEKDSGNFLLNFVTLAYTGPSRSRTTTPAAPFGLDVDESFANETAVLYRPDIEVALVESTTSGIRQGAIARYFREFSDPRTEYQLIPQADDDAAARARRFQFIRRLTMRVHMGPATELDNQAGTGVIKTLGQGYGAETIDIEFKASRERSSNLVTQAIRGTIERIIPGLDDVGVSKLILRGREHDDDPYEDIDLIQHRERRDRVLGVDDITRNIPHLDRWNALVEVSREFIQ